MRAPGRRPARLTVRAHLFDQPLRLCVLHEDEIPKPDSGGQALASYFVGNDPTPEDRSTLALAWAYAFGKRDEDREGIELSDPDESEDAASSEAFRRFEGRGSRRRPRRRGGTAGDKHREPAPSRELNDIDGIDLGKVGGTFLEGNRRGRLKASPKTKLKAPRKRGAGERSGTRGRRAGQRNYSDRDREDLAFDVVEAVLADTHGLSLEDIRDDKSAGADAVDRAKDIWVELKAHGQDASDTLRFEPAEAKRAEAKKDRYWLVVAWNLEKPRTPEFVVIPDPLRRLDTYLGRGLSLTGVQDLAAQSARR